MSIKNIVKFKKLLKEDEEAKEFNEKLYKDESSFYMDYLLKDTVQFSLCYIKNYHTLVLHNRYFSLIILDEEDKQYFLKKYVTPKVLEYERLQKELNDLNKD